MTAITEKNTPAIVELITRLRETKWFKGKTDESQNYEASLAAIAVALGIRKSASELTEYLPYAEEDFNIVSLLNSISALGFSPKKAHLNIKDIDERLLPCLFIPKENPSQPQIISFENGLLSFDSSLQVSRKIGNDNTEGEVYFFIKNEQPEAQKAPEKQWFSTMITRFKPIFIQIFAISIILNIFSLATPIFLMLVYDRVIGTHSPETLKPLMMGAIAAIFIEFALRMFRLKTLSWFGARLDSAVSNSIFEKLMLLPPTYTERASVASQVARVRSFEAIRDFFSGSLFPTLIEIPFALIVLACIFAIAGKLVIVPIIAAFAFLLLYLATRGSIADQMQVSAQKSASRQQYNIETFEKMHNLRCSGITSVWFRNYRDLSGESASVIFSSNFLSSIIDCISGAIFILAGLATIVSGIELVWAHEISAGALIASMVLTWRFLSPLQLITSSIPRIEQFKNTVAQINKLQNLRVEDDNLKARDQLNNIQGDIQFSSVGLRYTKELEPIFAGMSFKIKPGSLAAITGANGSGKSTILKLINAIYQPQAGVIAIDGINIRQISPIDLRRHISYVSQKPNLFTGTIAENMRFSAPLATDEQIISTLKELDIYADIEKLEGGIYYKIGNESSENIPNGLIYKLGVARALLKDSKIMLFDELPHSILNSHTGEKFKARLSSWRGTKTVIFVTHREDYIAMADTLIRLDTNQRPMISSPQNIILNKDQNEKAA